MGTVSNDRLIFGHGDEHRAMKYHKVSKEAMNYMTTYIVKAGYPIPVGPTIMSHPLHFRSGRVNHARNTFLSDRKQKFGSFIIYFTFDAPYSISNLKDRNKNISERIKRHGRIYMREFMSIHDPYCYALAFPNL
jgi:hypothetical protein